jgi:hypothetical protein
MHLDGLRRRRCNDHLARFTLLHFDIVQLHLCARTATLLPRYLGNFLFSVRYCRSILPERLKSAPSIIHGRLTRRIF